jgi:hypothetical protein
MINIKSNLQKKGCEVMDWIHLAQDVSSGSMKGVEFLYQLSSQLLKKGCLIMELASVIIQ